MFRKCAAIVLLALGMTSLVVGDDVALRIHIISGSREYKSEASLKDFQQLLHESYRVHCTASWGHDGIKELEDLDKLQDADLMIVFARRMKLGEKQMEKIRKHWESGKPVIGIRTAGHAFQKEDNEHFDRKVLGGHYSGHYGGEAVNVVQAKNAANHPVLAGVGAFQSKKLYKCGELPDSTTVLQIGDIGKAQHPVTIVHQYQGGRMFFTALGVPSDFENEHFRRMLVNAICWTTKTTESKLKR